MTTPAVLFLLPVAVVLLLGALRRPALNVFRVDARGLGHEHWTPRRRVSQAVSEAIARGYDRFDRLRLGLMLALRHPLFRPGLCVAALLMAVFVTPMAAAPFAMGVLTEGSHTAEAIIWEATQFKRESITVLSGQNLTAGYVVGRVTKGIGRISIPAVSGTGNGLASLVFAGPEVQLGSYVVTCSVAAANAGTFTVVNPAGKTLPTATVAVAYTSREINFTLADGSTDYIVGDVFTFVVSTTVPTVIGGTGSGVLSALSLGPDAKTGRYKINNDVVVANGGDMSVIGPDGNQVGGRFVWAASGSTAAFTSRQINFTISDATDYIANNYFDICVFNQLSGGKVVAWDPTTFDGRHQAYGVLYAATDATSADKTGVIVARDAIVSKGALQWAAAITSAQKESAYRDLAARGVVAIDAATT